MKKTKCDGESPCKRCKDDGLVCTAGSRKKTEFKQLPRGYAEVLENTQYALIATVQKLYTMIRNNESWDLGEPEMNDRGQPVIHDIASKLGCIRPSPDMPYAFPEGADDFAELQVQLQARSETESDDIRSRKHSDDSSYSSPALARMDRASSSESDHSNISKDYNQMLWDQQQRQEEMMKANRAAPKVAIPKPTPLNLSHRAALADNDSGYSGRTSFESVSLPSPIYTDFNNGSPMIRNDSPFSPWSAGDDFLSPQQSLDLTALYMRQQQFQPIPRSSMKDSIMSRQIEAMQVADGLNLADGTIRPNMLDCSNNYSMDQMDSIMFTGEYELPMGMA